MNRRGEVPDHGTASRYHGSTGVTPCRCRKCIDHVVREDTLRELDRLAGRPRAVPAGPTQRHILQLRNVGLSFAQIARAAKDHPTTIGDIAAGKRQHISRDRAQRVLAVPLTWRDTVGDVPLLGSTRRLRALYAIGHTAAHISQRTGISCDSIAMIVAGRWPTIEASRAEAIRRVYDELWSTPGTGAKTLLRAKREGWPGPLHWNDESIDDPNGFPDWTGACGEYRGYHRHTRNPELPPPCPPCRVAYSAGRKAQPVRAAA